MKKTETGRFDIKHIPFFSYPALDAQTNHITLSTQIAISSNEMFKNKQKNFLMEYYLLMYRLKTFSICFCVYFPRMMS